MAGVIVLPVLLMFLQSSRLSGSQPFHLFYPLSYYSQLPSVFLTRYTPYWLSLGYSAPVILALLLLFLDRKKHTLLKFFVVSGFVIMIFPILGRFLNGMAYMTNRWSWAFSLLAAYILAVEWENLVALSGRLWKQLLIGVVILYGLCLLLEKSRSAAAFSMIALLFITLIVLYGKPVLHKKSLHQVLVVIMACVSVINHGYWQFSSSAGNYISEFIENDQIEEARNNEANLVKVVADTQSDVVYPRFTGRSITKNRNLLEQISSTQYYWSLSNSYIDHFRKELEMLESMYQDYTGYDDRTSLIALSSVQYYVTKEEDTAGLPYGYTLVATDDIKKDVEEQYINELKEELGSEELTEEQEKTIINELRSCYSVYKNDYALPLGYCYDSYVSEDTWENMNVIQKQEIQLEAAYVSESLSDIAETTAPEEDYAIPYTVECSGDNITQTDEGFVTTANNTRAVLSFESEGNAETYLAVEGLEFEATPEYDLYMSDDSVDPLHLYNKTNWDLLTSSEQSSIRKEKLYWNEIQNATITVKSSAGISKEIEYNQEDATASSSRHDFVVNLGYMEDPVTSVTITFPTRGTYTIKNLQVYRVPMDSYAEKITSLQENTLQQIQLDTDTITGTLDIDSSKILCMAVPYSSGWKAYIDGQETETFVTNDRYLGIYVSSGSHNIVFRYRMPYKYAGLLVSIGGGMALVILILIRKKKCRKSEP
jgi:uncharacterized membrane protein YfhO